MTVYESLLTGTPVLGSDIGGIPELIQDGETGYLVPAGGSVALAEKAIEHFARSALERRQMRTRCAEYAYAALTLDRYLDGVQQVYREALMM
jgi:glycosyltransferase involved in cell wall biosynthesis